MTRVETKAEPPPSDGDAAGSPSSSCCPMRGAEFEEGMNAETLLDAADTALIAAESGPDAGAPSG